MADQEQLRILRQGADVWNAWRRQEEAKKTGFIRRIDLSTANLSRANLSKTNLSGTDLGQADLRWADLSGASLVRATLVGANLRLANLSGASLVWATLGGANLGGANLTGANLSRADLGGADLYEANLRGGDLTGADLRGANLTRADLSGADLTGCAIFGVSAWRPILSEGTKQQNLVISAPGEPQITADDIEVAQFLDLLMHNEKLQRVIDTIGKKSVLLLGRFTNGRIAVLEQLRGALRERDFLPIVFNFDKPETKTFTETVRLLAGMSRFVIADITNPRSNPLELQATVPECMVPFVPILAACRT
jgi:hypothetical protein